MQIYGIDLSKEKFDVFYLNSNKEEKSKTVKNNLAEISKFLLKLPKNVCLCAEHTGCYGDLLVHSCNQMEIPISLIPGYTIKHSLGISRGKSDPIDARKVREYGIRFSDKLKMTIYHTEDLAELREYHALRSQLVKTKKILLTSEKGRKHLPFQSIGVHKHNKTALDTIKAEIKAVEQEIEKIILHNNELANSLKLATSIQGIGPVIATELIIKTGNFKVINTAKKAASYAGVCPFPNSSGKMMGKSKVSNLADKKLKSLLFSYLPASFHFLDLGPVKAIFLDFFLYFSFIGVVFLLILTTTELVKSLEYTPLTPYEGEAGLARDAAIFKILPNRIWERMRNKAWG